MALRCVVVTPERTELDREAEYVSLPMFDGELGVLKGRAPMIGRLGYRHASVANRRRTRNATTLTAVSHTSKAMSSTC